MQGKESYLGPLGDVQPPPHLSKVLALAREKSRNQQDNYEDFLLYAERAHQSCASSGITIDSEYKIAGGIPIAGMQAIEVIDDKQNDTLLMVFNFYAKMKQTYHSTFSAADVANETMSFSEIEIFCRDFNLIPRLLNREDLKVLWEDIAQAHFDKGLGLFTVVDFAEFKDLIVRMALWAYNKPGLKKLILTIEGFMPKSVEVVRYFCTYLHLHDSEYIHNFIRTVGKKTQGDYNYRSKDETNLRTKIEVRLDTNARKVSQVKKPLVKDSLPPASPPSKTATAAGKKDTKSAKSMTSAEKDHIDDGSLSKNGGSILSGNTFAKTNAFGEKVKTPIFVAPASPSRVIRPKPKGSKLHNEEKKSLLPDSLLERLQMDSSDFFGRPPEEDGDFEVIGGPESSAKAAAPPANTKEKSRVQMSSAQSVGGYSMGSMGSSMVDDDDDDDEDTYKTGGSTTLSVFQDNSLRTMRECYFKNYDPRLALELNRYCYIPPKVVITDWMPTQGPYIDLGLLDGGSKVTIQLRISNGAPDEMHIDTTARNFGSDDTAIKTLVKPLIPGFSRFVIIEFTVPKHDCVVLGFAEVVCIAVRKGESNVISCPVFYRVDAAAERDAFPKCTGNRLPDLLGEKLPGRDRTFKATFEQKKLDGTWTNIKTKSLRLTSLGTRPRTSHN